MPLTIDAVALAALRRAGDPSAHHTRRPRRLRLDSDGVGIAVEIPAPRNLADFLCLPGHETFRSGAAVLARPRGSDETPTALNLETLARGLVEVLRSLPPADRAHAPYRDLQLFARHASAVGAYAREALTSWRALQPAPPPTELSNVAQRSAQTGAERQRRHKEQRSFETGSSARWALALYMEGDDTSPAPDPGARVPATGVYAFAVDALTYAEEEWTERVEQPPPGAPERRLSRTERVQDWRDTADDERLPPARPRIPSARTFYAIAQQHGFTRTRSHGTDYFTIPEAPKETPDMSVAEVLLDRSVRLLLEENRRDLGAPLHDTPTGSSRTCATCARSDFPPALTQGRSYGQRYHHERQPLQTPSETPSPDSPPHEIEPSGFRASRPTPQAPT